MVALEWRRPQTAVAGIITMPNHLPFTILWGREERFGSGAQRKISAKIENNETLPLWRVERCGKILIAEESQRPGFRPKYGAFHSPVGRSGKDRVGPAEPNKVAIQCVDFVVLLAFREVEFAFAKRLQGFGIQQQRLAPR